MKTLRILTALAVLGVSAAVAAPIESVESARACAAFQKVDAFLSEKVVGDQLVKLGVTPTQAKARLAQLSDAQLEQLAAQVDTLQAGGTIQSGNVHPFMGLYCTMVQIRQTIFHIFQLIFCWNDVY
jgi:hypothetical protein